MNNLPDLEQYWAKQREYAQRAVEVADERLATIYQVGQLSLFGTLESCPVIASTEPKENSL